MAKNNNWLIITLVVIIIAILGAWGYYYNSIYSKQQKASVLMIAELRAENEALQKELATTKVENISMEKEIIDQEQALIASKVAFIKMTANNLKGKVSAKVQESVDTIVAYVDEDPTVVLIKEVDRPKEIQDALVVVRKEMDKLGLTATQTENTKTIVTKSGEEVTIEEGEQYVVTGVLEPHTVSVETKEKLGAENPEEDLSNETMLGKTYSLTTDNGTKLYFLFNEEFSKTVDEDFVGKRVDITVEVTNISEDLGVVTYQVVKGPTLAKTE